MAFGGSGTGIGETLAEAIDEKNAQEKAAQEAERKKRAAAIREDLEGKHRPANRASTILTGSRGLANEPRTATNVLLGV